MISWIQTLMNIVAPHSVHTVLQIFQNDHPIKYWYSYLDAIHLDESLVWIDFIFVIDSIDVIWCDPACLSCLQMIHLLFFSFRTNPLGNKGHIAQRYGELVKDLWSGTSKAIAPLKLRVSSQQHLLEASSHYRQFNLKRCGEVELDERLRCS